MKEKEKRAIRDHARQRAAERYDLELSCRDLDEMTVMIQLKLAFPLGTYSGARTLYKLYWKDKELYAIYHRKYKHIRTFLTKEMVINNIYEGKLDWIGGHHDKESISRWFKD